MIYLCAGLFAEGPTDYLFLLGLLDRTIQTIAAEVLSGSFDDAPSIGIDAPKRLRERSREERVAAAIEESWSDCTLFVVHGDGAAIQTRRDATGPWGPRSSEGSPATTPTSAGRCAPTSSAA
jgi:hypothetical protein